MRVAILGGGLAAISSAFFLQENENIEEIIIIESEERLGGLCRSFEVGGICYDVGPHIIFSKDTEILALMNDLLDENNITIKRSNRIIHRNALVQYPFENDLSKLDKNDLNYCVNSFVNNPYESYTPTNMLQFFLKTFGSGITNLYLRPYNEKIWKFDPAFMDLQMVDRIPKPPKEDILRSAEGETVEGYTHQLYFNYPKSGGIESLVRAFVNRLNDKVKIRTSCEITGVGKSDSGFLITTLGGSFQSDRVISTIPINLLAKMYLSKDQHIKPAANNLRYNSIMVAIVNSRIDNAAENFAFMVADKNIIFHRISKLDFLGEAYHIENTATFMLEITYEKKKDLVYDDNEIISQIIDGLMSIGFINSYQDVNFSCLKRFEYAYVIYDLDYRKNITIVKDFFNREGILLNGRFGTFEYLNMDAVIRQSLELSKKF